MHASEVQSLALSNFWFFFYLITCFDSSDYFCASKKTNFSFMYVTQKFGICVLNISCNLFLKIHVKLYVTLVP